MSPMPEEHESIRLDGIDEEISELVDDNIKKLNLMRINKFK